MVMRKLKKIIKDMLKEMRQGLTMYSMGIR